MSIARVASRYAKSLLDLAKEGGKLEAVKGDLALFTSALESRDFELMLKSPIINGDKKRGVFKAIFDGKIDELTAAFFDIVIKKGRESFLPGIVSSFGRQYDEMHGITKVAVTAASSLTEETLSAIKAKLTSLGIQADKVEMTTEIDPSILGGFILSVDDRLYDASVKTKLANMRKNITDNTYI